MKLRRFNLALLMATSSIILKMYPASVQATKQESQPNEAFLEFLAEISVVDGEISDPLDMLDIDDEQMFNDTQTKQNTKPTEETHSSPAETAEEIE